MSCKKVAFPPINNFIYSLISATLIFAPSKFLYCFHCPARVMQLFKNKTYNIFVQRECSKTVPRNGAKITPFVSNCDIGAKLAIMNFAPYST